MNLSEYILEFLSEENKKKIKKLALAGGLAALGAGAAHKVYNQHKRNLRAEKVDRIANIAGLVGTATVGGLAGKSSEKLLSNMHYPVYKHTGIVGGALSGGVAHGIGRLASTGITRLVYGKDTFRNRHKKALLRGALTAVTSGINAKKTADLGKYTNITNDILQQAKNQTMTQRNN